MSKPTLLFIAPVMSRSGYGSHARDIVRSLIKMDRFRIFIWPIRWGSTPLNALKPGIDDDILNLIQKQQINFKPDISIQLTVPNEFQPIGTYNIGITAGIETTACSAEWLEGINRVNFVIVPSTFSKNVFDVVKYGSTDKQGIQQGELKCQVPIEILFEGIDTNIYKKTDRIDTNIRYKLKDIEENFNFLYVGHWLAGEIGHDRKDVGGLINTFLHTFKNRPNRPGLILKTGSDFSPIEEENLLRRISDIKDSIKGDLPNIYLILGELTDSEMNSLYNHPKIKVHISFTKGEGFGRPLLESSVSEKPIMVGGFGGQTDFLNNSEAIILPGELKQVHSSAVWDKIIIPESKWNYINYQAASNLMLDVWKRYDFYQNKSEQLGKRNYKKFTLDKMTEEFERILDKHLPKFAEQVPINIPKLPKLKKSDKDSTKELNIPRLPKLKKA